MTIAIAKWIGTLAPTIIFGVHEDSAFILTIGALCSVVDLAYIALLAWARRNPARLGADVHRNLVHAEEPPRGRAHLARRGSSPEPVRND